MKQLMFRIYEQVEGKMVMIARTARIEDAALIVAHRSTDNRPLLEVKAFKSFTVFKTIWARLPRPSESLGMYLVYLTAEMTRALQYELDRQESVAARREQRKGK